MMTMTRTEECTRDESGRSEIYVMSLEPGGGKSQVSSDNGTFRRWRKDGKEILYLNGDHMMMSVAVSGSGNRFQAGAAVPLFRVETQVAPPGHLVGMDLALMAE